MFHDSQLLIGFHNSSFNPTAKIVVELEMPTIMWVFILFFSQLLNAHAVFLNTDRWHLHVLSNWQARAGVCDEGDFVADEGFDVAQAYRDSARSLNNLTKVKFISITILFGRLTKHRNNVSKHVWPMHQCPHHQAPSLSDEFTFTSLITRSCSRLIALYL